MQLSPFALSETQEQHQNMPFSAIKNLFLSGITPQEFGLLLETAVLISQIHN